MLKRSVGIIAVAAVLLVTPASAWAAKPAGYLGVAGTVQKKVQATPQSPASTSKSELPFTGANLATFAVVGLALVGAGLALRRISSQRR
jgi:hypothetical protein